MCKRSPPGDAKVRLSAAFGAWPAERRKGLCRGQVEVFCNGSQVNSAHGLRVCSKVSGGVLAATAEVGQFPAFPVPSVSVFADKIIKHGGILILYRRESFGRLSV